jgi:hypothetical protein
VEVVLVSEAVAAVFDPDCVALLVVEVSLDGVLEAVLEGL